MAVGVCVSAKSPFCMVCRYGYPKETGEVVREPSPDPVAGDADRDMRGLVIVDEELRSSACGDVGWDDAGLDGTGDLTAAFSFLGPSSDTPST